MTGLRIHVLWSVATVAPWASTLSAQMTEEWVVFPPPGTYWGEFFSVGDRDSDGWNELCVFGGTSNGGGASSGVRVSLFDGSTGGLLGASTLSAIPGDLGQVARSGFAVIPDLTGDGVSDFLVGLSTPSGSSVPVSHGSIRLLDGVSLVELKVAQGPGGGSNFGRTIAEYVDVTGDGFPEYLIGYSSVTISPGVYGSVTLWDCLSWAQVPGWKIDSLGDYVTAAGPHNRGYAFGLRMTADADGDALPDVVIGDPTVGQYSQGILEWRTFAYPERIELFLGMTLFGSVGAHVYTVSDMDSDGVSDLAVSGAPLVYLSGEVNYVSGADLSLIKAVPMKKADVGLFSGLVFPTEDVGDLNHDGVIERVGSTWAFGAGTPVFGIYDGLSGKQVYQYHSSGSDLLVGIREAAVRPGSAMEPITIVLPRLPSRSWENWGLVAVTVHVPAPGAVSGCHALQSTWSGWLPNLQAEVTTLEVEGATPSQMTLCLLSLNAQQWYDLPLPLDMAPFGAPGCSLGVAPDLVFPVLADVHGRASTSISIQGDAALLGGVPFYAQWAAYTTANPLNLATSNAIEFTILP